MSEAAGARHEHVKVGGVPESIKCCHPSCLSSPAARAHVL